MFGQFRVVALVVTAVLGLGAPPGRAGDVVRIGWLRATNDLALARRHGSLEAALARVGARVEWAGPFAAAAPALEALNAGSVDVTVASSTAAVTAMAAGVPLVLFAYQRLGARAEAIVVPEVSTLREAADLVGRTVAVNRGGTGDYLLGRALATNAIDPAKVTRVFLGPGDAGPAFAQGHVDAWAVWDPFLTLALTKFKGRVLLDGGRIGSRNAVVMAASRAFAEAHRPLLAVVYDVIAGENAWSLAHPAEAGAIWADILGLPADLAETLGANDASPTGPLGPVPAAEIAGVAAWYGEAGLVPGVPDVSAHVLDLSSK